MAARKNVSKPPRKAPVKTAPSTKKPSTTPSRSSGVAAKSSARSTMSGPSRKGSAADISDAATAKIAGTETVAGSMPYNAAKSGEFGDAAMEDRKSTRL